MHALVPTLYGRRHDNDGSARVPFPRSGKSTCAHYRYTQSSESEK